MPFGAESLKHQHCAGHFLALSALKHCYNICTKLLCQRTASFCLDSRWITVGYLCPLEVLNEWLGKLGVILRWQSDVTKFVLKSLFDLAGLLGNSAATGPLK